MRHRKPTQIDWQRWRAYLYRLATAAGVVAVGYGLITDTQAALWLGLAGALFAVPAANTPTKP
ncbi:phage holin [Mycetocola saprophilus]|uniref:phage holin n=1 Tax=Mycetocola saprophilus TaxID=76636 RepID=UPI003BEF58B5